MGEKFCVNCELSDDCPAILLGCRGFGDCSLYIEKKVGIRKTWIEVKRDVKKWKKN